MTAIPSAQRDDQQQREGGAVTITVNDQPVVLQTHRVTGRQIKDAAIAQGVKIQPDFVLTEELPGDKSRVIRDDEVIEVHKGSEFTAVTPDDNS